MFGSLNDNEEDLFCIYNCVSNSWLWDGGFRPAFIGHIFCQFLSVQVDITQKETALVCFLLVGMTLEEHADNMFLTVFGHLLAK